MDIKKIKELINDPLINKAELARRMFPNNKAADRNLDNKLAENKYRRLTEKDCESAMKIFSQFCEQIQRTIRDAKKQKIN